MDEDQLIEAIQNFFSDTSRSPQETREGLERALDTIAELLDTLPKE